MIWLLIYMAIGTVFLWIGLHGIENDPQVKAMANQAGDRAMMVAVILGSATWPIMLLVILAGLTDGKKR